MNRLKDVHTALSDSACPHYQEYADGRQDDRDGISPPADDRGQTQATHHALKTELHVDDGSGVPPIAIGAGASQGLVVRPRPVTTPRSARHAHATGRSRTRQLLRRRGVAKEGAREPRASLRRDAALAALHRRRARVQPPARQGHPARRGLASGRAPDPRRRDGVGRRPPRRLQARRPLPRHPRAQRHSGGPARLAASHGGSSCSPAAWSPSSSVPSTSSSPSSTPRVLVDAVEGW